MKKFFANEKIKAVLIIVLIFYAATYFSVLHNSSFIVAQKFVETDAGVISKFGPIKWVIPAFLGRAVERNGEAYYTMYVLGEQDGGEALVRLSVQDQEWKVIGASLITNKNQVVVLKEETDH